MDRSNKIKNLVNQYVERHIRDRHLNDDTIKEIKISYVMVIKDLITIIDESRSIAINNINQITDMVSSITNISNINKYILETGIALGVNGITTSICRSLSSDKNNDVIDVIKEILNNIEYENDWRHDKGI
jgi:hypothetical protein|nr:MAG TPA: hypothetical protein [Caudoviricetes sp.]